MMTSTAAIHRIVHRLAPVLGLLLLVALFAGGIHRHDDERGHVCAVCTVGHSSAVAAGIVAPATAPPSPGQALHGPAPGIPRTARVETASSRAPPRS